MIRIYKREPQIYRHRDYRFTGKQPKTQIQKCTETCTGIPVTMDVCNEGLGNKVLTGCLKVAVITQAHKRKSFPFHF